MNEARPAGLLKISELARSAGVSPSTVKYYVKEGLVEIAFKTGPNMAYYRPESVERVKLIKTLQSEKFYPLAVIKQLLGSGEIDLGEVELLDAIHKTGRGLLLEQVTAAEALRLSGVKRAELEALVQAGVITPVTQGKKRFLSRSDCRILALVKRRTQAGIPFAQTLCTLRQYTQHLQGAVMADIEELIREALLDHTVDTREIVRIIRTSDETLDEFVTLKRYELNRALGSAQLGRLERLRGALEAYLRFLAGLLETDYPHQAAQCAAGFANGPGTNTAACYRALLSQTGSGIAATLSAAREASVCFSAPPEGGAHTPEGVLAWALYLGWRHLAPAILCGGEAAAPEDAANTALFQSILAYLTPKTPQ